MDESKQVFIGTDCGATMSKVGAVWADGLYQKRQAR